MADTRYLLKVYSVEVSTLPPPVSKAGSKLDLRCASFCDNDVKKLALQLSNAHGIVNLPEEEDKGSKSFFLKQVPVWGTCVMAIGCYLLGSAARKPSIGDTLQKINRAAKAVEGLALVVHDLLKQVPVRAMFWGQRQNRKRSTK